jgi:hypothetical protein
MVSFSVPIHTFVCLNLLLLRDIIVVDMYVPSVPILSFVSAHSDRRVGRSSRQVGRHITQNFISWLRYLKNLRYQLNSCTKTCRTYTETLTWPYEWHKVHDLIQREMLLNIQFKNFSCQKKKLFCVKWQQIYLESLKNKISLCSIT